MVFYIFATLLALFGLGFITFKQPVYAALSFTGIVLTSCVLFVLSQSPFLAAAHMVVYAGATIIIFLFVLMFSQRARLQSYDVTLNHPILACFIGGGLLGLLISGVRTLPEPIPPAGFDSKVSGLGQLMYSDYMWTVVLAGILLLIATIAAIVIAEDDKQAVIGRFEQLVKSKADSRAQSGSDR